MIARGGPFALLSFTLCPYLFYTKVDGEQKARNLALARQQCPDFMVWKSRRARRMVDRTWTIRGSGQKADGITYRIDTFFCIFHLSGRLRN